MILVISVAGLKAQVSTATISGTVTDASGAAVAGAMITVKNSDTGVTNTTVSDNQGRYNVPSLIIGPYEVDVEATGFKKYSHSGITLTVGSQIVVDAPLEVGTVAQTVTVESDVSHVETTSMAVTNLVQQTQINDLPLNGRNYYSLIALAPGVLPIGNGGGGGFYGGQQNFAVSGGRPSGQAYLVDDTNTADFWNHGTGSGALGTTLGVDSIAELQTMLNTYGAQFGGSGAAFNASTKSGTNSFHGTVYEFLLNSATNASSQYIPVTTPTPKPYDNRNQFGFSLGGPVKKDKAFFFVNWERLQETQASLSQLSEPDLLARGCTDLASCIAEHGVGPNTPQIFSTKTNSYVAVPYAACNGGNPALYPNSMYPLGNGCTAQANIKATLSLLPIGYLNDTATSGLAQTANVVNPTYNHENYIVGRFDYTLSDKDSVFAKFTSDLATSINQTSLGYLPNTQRTADTYVTLEERRIFSPTLLNVVHLSYVRPNEIANQYGNPLVTNTAITGGHFANCFGCITDSPTWYFPPFGVDGREASSPEGISASSTEPYYLIPNNFTIGDDVVWTKGSHSFKFGMSIERMDENTWAPFETGASWGINSAPFQVDPATGNYIFTAKNGVATNTVLNVNSSLAGFIAGQATSAGPGELPESTLKAAGLPPQDGTLDVREMVFSPYFQDDWKVTSRLTLNLGVRYSPTIDPLFVRHLNENLQNAPWDGAAFGSFVTTAPTGGNGVYPTGTNCTTPINGSLPLACGFIPVTHPFSTNVSLKNIDPRVGVAWDPFKDHKTSIRAGIGFYHVIVLARDYDMWIQPPSINGSESINTNPLSAQVQNPGSPFNYPFMFNPPAGAAPYAPCAFTSQPTTINVPAGVNGANAGTFTNCEALAQGGSTYYGWSKSPYNIQYNVNVQREVMPSTIASIGFVGSRGVDLVGQRDDNPFIPCGGTVANGLPAAGYPIYEQGYSTVTNGYVNCPRMNPDMLGLSLLNAFLDSWYSSLQGSLQRRFSHGFQLQASYTYSKSIDIVDGSYGLDGGGSVTDPWNYQVNKGVQSNSRGQNLRLSGVYVLPFHKNQLVSGWQLTSIYTYLSGAPFSVSGASIGSTYAASTVNYVAGCNPYIGGVSPQQATNKFLTGTTASNAGVPLPSTWVNTAGASASIAGGSTSSYLNPNCFTPVTPGAPGDLGKNVFTGPGGWAWDGSVLKDTKISKISENFDIQFRAELFNIFNHPTWGAPSASLWSLCTNATCSTTGVPGGITNTNTVQGANNSSTSFGSFGAPSSTPRRMQFGLRIIF